MAEQTILFTSLPNGRVTGAPTATYRLSVVVSPRLRNPSDTTLAEFPDWVDWPSAVSQMTFVVDLPDLGHTAPATVVSSPDSARWTALFPSSTLVRGFDYQGIDHTKIWSYPSRNLRAFVRDRWTRFAVSDPEDHPTFEDLIGDDAFGAVGFEQLGSTDPAHPDGDGPTRKRVYLDEIEQHFDTTSDDPSDWSLGHDPNGLATAKGQAEQFLRWERYHRRGRTDRTDAPAPPDDLKELDLHEAVALSMDYGTLPRLLGLVIDLEFELSERLAATDTRVRVGVDWTPQLTTPPDPVAAPFTRCDIGSDFTARPKNPSATDYAGRWLALGDSSRFDAMSIDVDGAAARVRQFADNLTRSRRAQGGTPQEPAWEKFSDMTPDRFALPHQSSGGLQIVRVDKARQTAGKAAEHLSLNGQLVDSNGDPGPSQPDLYLEDLVRGYRWDVDDQDQWRSLMAQQGHYHFLAQGTAGDLPVAEEGVSGASASSAGGSDGAADELYVSESLMRWDGWSLSNQLLGSSLDDNQETSDGTPGEDPSMLPFRTSLQVPPGSLPRLRFGRTYRVRGRAVDLAGNSEELAATEPAGTALDSAYFRFEPVESPTVVLGHEPTSGETAELVVIRSEDGSTSDTAAGQSLRHLVPPQSGQLFAEQHGVLDTGPGGAVDKSAYAQLATLDAGHLGTHPDREVDPTRPDDSFVFPVDTLTLNYLPDPMCRRAMLRGLPTATTAQALPFDTAAWPAYGTGSLLLEAGASKFTIDDAKQRLAVTLAKADVADLRLSAGISPTDLGKLGLWSWIADAGLSAGQLADLEALAVEGRHWMLTPWRRVRLVHAVRTPLGPPSLHNEVFNATRSMLGQTDAVLQELVGFHLTSTGRVDIRAAWSMPIDRGPGTPPPATKPFDTTAISIELERFPTDDRPLEPEPRILDHRHEFGDTRHRVVTYTPVATSAFVDFFREQATVTLNGETPTPVVSGGAIEAETVTVETFGPADPNESNSREVSTKHRRAQPGRPATGDFMVDGPAGEIVRTPTSLIADGAEVTVSFVRPKIHTTGEPATRSIPSSARPAAPVPRWALPTFGWEGDGSATAPSTRTHKGIRIYLERPWWSSGDGEKLGVCLVQNPSQAVPEHLEPFVSQVGFDPVHESGTVPGNLGLVNLPAATAVAEGLPVLGAGDPTDASNHVNIAGHEVAFDAERDLWYCDIDIELLSNQDTTYWPFVRLALCRYQPESLPNAHLSAVVLADFVQLAPARTVSVVPTRGGGRRVSVTGRTLNDAVQASPDDWFTTRMRFRVERQMLGATDPDLGWEPLPAGGSEVTVEPSLSDFNQATWTGTVNVPNNPNRPMRLVVEELEQHRDGTLTLNDPNNPGAGTSPGFATRITHVDVIDLS